VNTVILRSELHVFVVILVVYMQIVITFVRVTGINWLMKLWQGGFLSSYFEPVFNVHSPLHPSLTPFFYLPFFNSVAKKDYS